MADLPSGIVTFLFTDIQGSTQLWQNFPGDMPAALAQHHALLTQAIETHGGYLFQIIGDAFCGAFHTARDGLLAAITAQRWLQAADWRATGSIRVRMALHAGAAEVRPGETTSGEYVSGITLSRAARLLSAGHGGQVLVSLPAAELVRDNLPEGVSLVDLGAHRLKDLVRPEHIYQAVTADLPSDFPPLKTADLSPNNLPQSMTSFIGREKELAALDEILRSRRLVTLTGSGGVGKTRLAIETGKRLLPDFAEGVWLVELAPLADPGLVPQAVASTLGIQETQNRAHLDVLTETLRGKQLLLILDNCEHLIEACAQLADHLLHACPELTILASSREALGLEGERPYHVPSLSLPSDGNQSLPDPSRSEALQLFIERAETALPGFHLTPENSAAAVQVCRRLDGIPLAIELAAARVKTLRVEQIAQRLDDRFRLLTGGSRTALPRQQTLRATIDWSYELLSQAERDLLQRLTVFSGGCTLEAAEAICSGEGVDEVEILDLLTNLVNKSMVVDEREQGQETRFRLLETIRQYAREMLFESGQATTVRDRHLRYYTEWAEMADPKTRGPQQAEWLERMEGEHENIRTALEWAGGNDPTKGLRLASALWWFWWMRNYALEGLHWLSFFCKIPQSEISTLERGRALGRLGYLAMLDEFASAAQWASECLAISHVYGAESDEAFAHYVLGWIDYQKKKDYQTARDHFEKSLAIYQSIGDAWGLARIYFNLGVMAQYQGDPVPRRAFLEKSLALCREAGDLRGLAIALDNMASVIADQGDLRAGRELVEEAIRIYRQLEASGAIGNAIIVYGSILCWQGDYAGARAIYEEDLEISNHKGKQFSIASSKGNLGLLALWEGKNEQAAEIFEDCLAQLDASGSYEHNIRWSAMAGLANARMRMGDLAQAKTLLEVVLARTSDRLEQAETFLGSGLLATLQEDGETAIKDFQQSMLMFQECQYRLGFIPALEGYAGALQLLSRAEEAVCMLGVAARFRQRIEAPIAPGDKPRLDRLHADLLAQLGETALALAWERCQAIEIDEAVTTILEEIVDQ